MTFDLKEHPHRRFNPLTREWVLVSPRRTDRPWLGHAEKPSDGTAPEYDPDCYMCPGNVRARGERNPAYTGVFVFDNDYPAIVRDVPRGEVRQDHLIIAQGESGICRVVCFSPRHNVSIATMPIAEICGVVEVWTDEFEKLASNPAIGHVQIFENRGTAMGASNPHPHCQIWGTASLPNEPAKELAGQQEFMAAHHHCLLCQYLRLEQRLGERIVFENEYFSVVVPFWAIWPFEVMVLSQRHAGSLPELAGEERLALADVLKQLTTRYDHLFQTPFPYSMGIHQPPTDGSPHPEWHLHFHFYPPLLRSAAVRKFMVGFEMLGEPQRDITAETAAQWLRDTK